MISVNANVMIVAQLLPRYSLVGVSRTPGVVMRYSRQQAPSTVFLPKGESAGPGLPNTPLLFKIEMIFQV
jgi:hypothetical protein